MRNPRIYFHIVLSFLAEEEEEEAAAASSSSEKMKFLATYLLAKLGGNENPSADDLKKILGSVGAEVDDGKIELLLSLVKDHDLAELVAMGKEKMAVLSSSGVGVAGVAAGTGSGAPAETAGAVAKEKEEKKKEEVDEESDDGALFSLFD